jgi:hypothetical protein
MSLRKEAQLNRISEILAAGQPPTVLSTYVGSIVKTSPDRVKAYYFIRYFIVDRLVIMRAASRPKIERLIAELQQLSMGLGHGAA